MANRDIGRKVRAYLGAVRRITSDPDIVLGRWVEVPSLEGSQDRLALPRSLDDLVKRLEEIRSVYREDGEINPTSPFAETYAIALGVEKNYAESKRIFNAVVGDNPMPLRPDEMGYVDRTVGKAGALGYQGVLAYADVCLALGERNRAIDLLMMIANLPGKNETYAVADFRLAALDILVGKLKQPLRRQLKKAEARAY